MLEIIVTTSYGSFDCTIVQHKAGLYFVTLRRRNAEKGRAYEIYYAECRMCLDGQGTPKLKRGPKSQPEPWYWLEMEFVVGNHILVNS
ncbi:hypothetical protein [Polluticoccus soli]|uniref:hypothetical protein n=1 Tax=Polluticoccus soli TaxID=3034150 RepID=UPI0023E18B5D|nr:hypothetical protein [Flavipsychrobacter sp. JY13-12]